MRAVKVPDMCDRQIGPDGVEGKIRGKKKHTGKRQVPKQMASKELSGFQFLFKHKHNEEQSQALSSQGGLQHKTTASRPAGGLEPEQCVMCSECFVVNSPLINSMSQNDNQSHNL